MGGPSSTMGASLMEDVPASRSAITTMSTAKRPGVNRSFISVFELDDHDPFTDRGAQERRFVQVGDMETLLILGRDRAAQVLHRVRLIGDDVFDACRRHCLDVIRRRVNVRREPRKDRGGW